MGHSYERVLSNILIELKKHTQILAEIRNNIGRNENIAEKKSDLPKGIFWRNNTLWIRYTDDGEQRKESAKTTDVDIAKNLLTKRKQQITDKRFGARIGAVLKTLELTYEVMEERHAKRNNEGLYVRRLFSLVQTKDSKGLIDIDNETEREKWLTLCKKDGVLRQEGERKMTKYFPGTAITG